MATTLPQLPPPPDPQISRFDPSGRPTIATVVYEQKMHEYLKALGAAVQGT